MFAIFGIPFGPLLCKYIDRVYWLLYNAKVSPHSICKLIDPFLMSPNICEAFGEDNKCISLPNKNEALRQDNIFFGSKIEGKKNPQGCQMQVSWYHLEG